MENAKEKLTTVSSEDGVSLSVVGDTYRTVITGKQTKGAYAVIDMLVPPGGGPGPHSHPDFQEAFYVLEGEVEVRTELETYTAKKGSFVNIPSGGIIHSFKNKGQITARLLCTVVPSGLEEFFGEIGIPVAHGVFLSPQPMDPEAAKKLEKIASKYHQKVFPPDYLDK